MGEQSTSEAAATAGARERIDDEHRRLGALLEELLATRDLARSAALLDDLRELLVHHFATEEAADGLHAVVREHASHRLPDLQLLFREHREMLTRLDALRAAVAACLAGPVSDLERGIAGLADALRAHEAVEDGLFGEAFYLDLGGRS